MTAGTSTEVEIRVGVDGTVTPLSFTWRGVVLRVAQVGRAWSDEKGEHWLVMTVLQSRVFELILTPDGTWIVRATSRPAVA